MTVLSLSKNCSINKSISFLFLILNQAPFGYATNTGPNLHLLRHPDAFIDNDIKSEGYLNMVALLIDIYTGKLSIESDKLKTTILKWIPIQIVEMDAWCYGMYGHLYDDMEEGICIDYKKLYYNLMKDKK